jgi:hypothetical protein
MDRIAQLKSEARESEVIATLERDQARIDRLIVEEERRRQQIADRLGIEIRRLDTLRRAH